MDGIKTDIIMPDIIKTHDIDTDHRRHNQYIPLPRKKKKDEKKDKHEKPRNKDGRLDIQI